MLIKNASEIQTPDPSGHFRLSEIQLGRLANKVSTNDTRIESLSSDTPGGLAQLNNIQVPLTV